MIIIYGKKNCPSCKAAVQLCDTKQLDYEYHDIDEEKITAEYLIEKSGISNLKSVPQIWSNRMYIGGYTQLEHYASNVRQLNS